MSKPTCSSCRAGDPRIADHRVLAADQTGVRNATDGVVPRGSPAHS